MRVRGDVRGFIIVIMVWVEKRIQKLIRGLKERICSGSKKGVAETTMMKSIL